MNADGGLSQFFCAVNLAGLVLCTMVPASPAADSAPRIPMQLTSAAFHENQSIPSQYTCDDKNVSPPLKWTGNPAAARSLALIADDPDAPGGTWVHWVLYDIPSATTELPED